jgi:hypothetical protein
MKQLLDRLNKQITAFDELKSLFAKNKSLEKIEFEILADEDGGDIIYFLTTFKVNDVELLMKDEWGDTPALIEEIPGNGLISTEELTKLNVIVNLLWVNDDLRDLDEGEGIIILNRMEVLKLGVPHFINDIKGKLVKWLSDEYTPSEAQVMIDEANIVKKEVYVITYKNKVRDIVEIKEKKVTHLN